MQKDTEFSHLENKVKLSLLQAEKRLVDLEVSAAEIKELKDRLSEIDFEALKGANIGELKQRLDDLEDVIMVENLGVEELKKMMEDVRDKLQQPSPTATVSPEMETKVASIDELHSKMSALEEVHGKMSAPEELKLQISTLTSEIDALKSQLSSGVPAKSGEPTIDMQVVTTKVENLRSLVDNLLARRNEMQMKLDGLEKSMILLQSGGVTGVTESVTRDIENNKRDLVILNSRLDSLERVAKDLSENALKIDSSVKKFESFERASALSKELESRLEEFKFIEGEIRRLSGRIEMVYDNIDKRLDKVKNVEKKFPEVLDAIAELEKDIDKNRLDVLERAKKDDLEEIRRKFELKILDIDKRVPDTSSTIASLARKVDENRIMVLDRPKKDEVLSMIGKVSKGSELGRIKEELRAESEELVQNLRMEKADLETSLTGLSTQISELLNRLVMLESRIGSLERMVRDTRAIQPIILE